MPFVEVRMLTGRTPEQKRALMAEVTDAVERAVAAPRQSIRVVITEFAPEHWSIGGVPKSESDGPNVTTRS